MLPPCWPWLRRVTTVWLTCKMIDRLKLVNLALHGQLVAEKPTHAQLLLDDVRSLWDLKKVVKKEEKEVRWLTVEQAK